MDLFSIDLGMKYDWFGVIYSTDLGLVVELSVAS